MPSDSQRHPIVLGIDALHPTHLAIAWAADEADRWELPLRLVHAVPPMVHSRPFEEGRYHEALREFGDEALGGASRFVQELAKASEHALAVVVGRRGRGGFTGMQLGSVPHRQLHRAHCPVVTVPFSAQDRP